MKDNNKKKVVKNRKSLVASKPEVEITPPKPFHEIWPYGLSWEVINGKKMDTNYAYFSYDDDRKKYIDKYLKNVNGIKKFKTKARGK